MARDCFDILGELLARDVDRELVRPALERTPSERIIWLEAMHAFARSAKDARRHDAERAPRPPGGREGPALSLDGLGRSRRAASRPTERVDLGHIGALRG